MAYLPACIRGLTVTTLTDVSLLELYADEGKREKMGKKKNRERNPSAYFASVWWHNEERLYVMLLEEGVSLVSEAWLHLVVAVQTLQGGPCDVHLTESRGQKAVSDKSQAPTSQIIINLIIFYRPNSPSACSKFFTAKKFPF